MGEYDPNVWGLGNKSESLLDAPKLGWGERMLSQRKEEKVDPIGDLGKFAADTDAKGKELNAKERNGWRAVMEKGIKFTDPVKVEAGMPPILKGKFPNEDQANAVGSSADHDWKITSGEEENTWTVAQGNVFYLNDSTTATVASTSVEGETGGIYLHIERNPATRLATAQTVEFYVETPLTTETDQFIELGAVGGTPAIIQKQFTPVRVFEDLFVINGEFKLGSIAMLADNLYTPPV